MRWIGTAALLLLAGTAWAEPKGTGFGEPMWERFDNGVTVALENDEHASVAVVTIRVLAGSAMDPPGLGQMAHIVEHAMFRAAEGEDAGHIETVARMGGFVNAFTEIDATTYVTAVPVDRLEDLLRLEARRFARGLDGVPLDDLAKEKEIVRQEALEKRPYTVERRALDALLFPPGHPYHEPAEADLDDLDRIQGAGVVAFQKEAYAPDRIRIGIAGGMLPGKTLELVRELFGALPAPEHASTPAAVPRPPRRKARATLLSKGRESVALVGWVVPSSFHDDSAALGQMLSLMRRFVTMEFDSERRGIASVGLSRRSVGDLAVIEVELRALGRLSAGFVTSSLAVAYSNFESFLDDRGGREALEEALEEENSLDWLPEAQRLDDPMALSWTLALGVEWGGRKNIPVRTLGRALDKYMPLDEAAVVISNPIELSEQSK